MKKTTVTLSLVLVMLISVVNHAQDLPRGGSGLSKQELAQEESIAAETDPQVDLEGLAAYYVWYAPEQKEDIQRAIASLGGKTTFEFDPTLVPALVVLLPVTQAVQASTLAGVTFMEPVPEHRPTSWTERDAAAWRAAIGWAPEARKPQVVPWNVDQVQARDVWDLDRDGVVDEGAPDGSGVRFCIIDSGFFRDHDDFQGIVASGSSQITGEDWYEDGCGHGTHVAGTANAMNNSYGVVGVMPGGAELRILKIFANDCSWQTGQSNLGTAAQWCRDQGANAISMSLGGGYSSTEDAIFQGLYDNDGIIVIAAAGNDGNSAASYPASYDSVISVAALRQDEVVASFSQFPATAYDPNNPPANVEWDVVELSAGGQGVLSTVPSPYGDIPQYEMAVDGVTYYGMHIDESAYGSPSAQLVDGGLCGSTNGAWSGQIVLCERGTYSFADKVNNVRNSEGLGAVIYNNASGNFSGTCGGGCTQPSIPAISLSQEDGQYLVANKLGYVGNLVVDNGASTCPECVGGYDIWDGTSMATPGVAAGVAWVWDSCSGPAGITNKDLRQLLRDSAKDLSGTRQDEVGNSYTYGEGWDQHSGWGLIQLKDALDLGGERFGWQTCPPPGPFVIDSSPREAAVCTLTPTSVVYDLDVGGKDFEGSIDLSATGYPAGATAVFGDNPIVVVPAGDWEPTTLTIDNLGSATAGAYALAISGVDQADPTNVFQVDVALNVYTDAPDSAVLIGPADGAAGEAALPTFSWQPTAQAQGYTLQIATDPAFTQNLREVTGVTSPYTLGDPALASGTVYYWRVRATNICGSQDSATWAFRTAAYGCTTYTSTNVPQAISNRSWTQSTLTIPDSLIFDNVDVNIDQIIHTNDADLDIYIRHPDMTQIDLSTDNGGSGDNYTLTIFDNEAATPITSGSAPFTGRFQPEGNLGALYNKNAQGTWTLRVYDDANPNTGTLNAWSLTVCGGSAPMPADYSDLAGSYGVAWHTGDGAVRLGTGWDADTTFSPTDDNDSDDGVSFPNGWAPGQSNTVRVNVQGTPTHGRWLRLWFDWNDDGVFEDTTGPGGERVYDGTVVGDNNDLGVSVPAGLNQPVNYRARLYDSAGAPTGVLAQDAGSFGGADGGEVEDGTKEAPTAVTLTRFEAWPAGPAIHVEWEAATELDNLGFNLYRSDAIDGVYQRLNSYLIPAQVPGSPAGAAYFWTDRQVAPGQVYYYKLEAVDLHGVAMFYGQVSATAAHVAHLPLVIK